MDSILIKYHKNHSIEVLTKETDDIFEATQFFADIKADKEVTSAELIVINHSILTAFNR